MIPPGAVVAVAAPQPLYLERNAKAQRTAKWGIALGSGTLLLSLTLIATKTLVVTAVVVGCCSGTALIISLLCLRLFRNLVKHENSSFDMLISTTKKGKTTFLRFLLNVGANPNAKGVIPGFGKISVLKYIALTEKNDSLDTTKMLLSSDNTRSGEQLVWAHFEEIAKVAEKKTKDDEARKKQNEIRRGAKIEIEEAVESGREAKVQKQYEATRGQLRLIRRLFQAGVSIDSQNRDGFTYLNYAVHRNLPKLALEILSFHPNCNTPNKNKETPLPEAVNQGHSHLIQQLVKAGATGGEKLLWDLTEEAIKEAKNKDESLVRYRAFQKIDDLLFAGVNVNCQDGNANTCLIRALRAQDRELANVLLFHQPDEKLKANDGESALSLARQYAYKDLEATFGQPLSIASILFRQSLGYYYARQPNDKPMHPKTLMCNKILIKCLAELHKTLDEAADNGDCFLHSFARGLNRYRLQQRLPLVTVKDLRQQVSDHLLAATFKEKEGWKQWFRGQNLELFGTYEQWKANVAQHWSPSPSSAILWAHPTREGRILCEIYGVNLKIYTGGLLTAENTSKEKAASEVLQSDENEMALNRELKVLLEENGPKLKEFLEDERRYFFGPEDNEGYHKAAADAPVIEIAARQGHYMPVFPI